ncbi:MAG: hypothetical protein LJE70_19930 [Chromatiaceae bacterium]|nr:hypothetical protein [Chromatiaceae bacterium]
MNALAMTPQSRKATLVVDIPLHTHTDSEQDVAEIVGKLLNEISRFDHRSSPADILQALAIITAVREAMADAAEKPGVDFSLKLLDVEVGSDHEVATYAS